MAEEKNNFINCKMNRDIDDRLIPNGQYREAINLQISRSEGANVGALQNVLGNELIIDFFEITEIPNLKSIGTYVDDNNNNIYIFLTDYTDDSGINTYNPDAYNFIYSYNTITGLLTKLVEGEWLNFSTTNPIYGINLLENLLFWTDNRNQPRKINVVSATQTPGYYSSFYQTQEAQISVAKLNPWQPINLYKESELATGNYETTMYDVVSEFLPSAIPGGTAKVDGTVLATDTVTISDLTPATFYPLPGQIIQGAAAGTKVVSFDAVTLILVTDLVQDWTNDVDLSFNGNPYYNPNYGGDTTFLEDKFVRFSYRFRFDDGEYSLMAPFTQPAFIPKQDGYFEYLAYYNEVGSGGEAYPGIDDETNTYQSTIVNFMKNKVNNILLQIPLPYLAIDLFNAYKIIELDILYKESDGLTIGVIDTIPVATLIPLGNVVVYEYNYESKKPYKTLPQSEITRVYDKVPIKALAQEVISNRVVYGNYQDKFSYPKYLDYTVGYKEKQPFDITEVNPTFHTTSYIEYPNHSVKQNRIYQVGLVLSDQFGRTSGVILSNSVSGNSTFGASTVTIPYSKNDGTYDPFDFPGLALNIQFNEPILLSSPNQTMAFPGIYNPDTKATNYNPLGWVSYKIVVKQTQQDYYNVYLPGVIAGYPSMVSSNIGTISHTTLINDNINKVPRDLKEIGPTQVQFSSSAILYPRVNNVPCEVLPDNGVLPPIDPRNPIGNVQYYPGNTRAFVNTISTLNSLFDSPTISPSSLYNQFYDATSNPLIARLSTTEKLGALANDPIDPDYITRQGVQYLAIYETKPVESRLDIYWETTTTGLINELNDAIANGGCGAVSIMGWDTFLFDESFDIGQYIVGPFYPIDDLNNPITASSMTLTSVNSLAEVGGSSIRTSDFELVKFTAGTPLPDTSILPYDCYFIRTTSYFYYGVNANIYESFTFNLTVSSICIVTGELVTYTFNNLLGALENVTPTITNCEPIIVADNPATIPVYQFEAVNGANPLDLDALGNPQQLNDLVWEVIGQTQDGNPVDLFYFGDGPTPLTPNTNGLLKCYSPELISGSYEVEVRVCDVQGGGGRKCTTCAFTLVYDDTAVFYPLNNCLASPNTNPVAPEDQLSYDSQETCAADTFQCREFLIQKIGSGSSVLWYNACNEGGPGTESNITIINNTPILLCAYNLIGHSGDALVTSQTGNVGACPF